MTDYKKTLLFIAVLSLAALGGIAKRQFWSDENYRNGDVISATVTASKSVQLADRTHNSISAVLPNGKDIVIEHTGRLPIEVGSTIHLRVERTNIKFRVGGGFPSFTNYELIEVE